MGFYAAFNSISVISRRLLTLFMSSWVSLVLGWGSEVSCPRTLPRKNPEDPVRLEPRTPGLRVKHPTTEPRRTPSKLKDLADNNFRFYENGSKFSQCVEKTVGKGEIACNKQFLLFPQCFQGLVLQTGKNKGLLGRGLTLLQTSPGFYVSAVEVFWKHCGEKEKLL